MSVKTETSGLSSGFPMSSTYDMGFGESDIESLGSDTSVEGGIPKDYWFGRKYFECVIAQDQLHHSRLYEDVAVVDSRLEKAMQRFPYLESLKELRLQGLESLLPVIDENDSCDAYRTTMSCVGAVVRSGDRKQKAILLAVIRQCAALSEPDDQPQTPKSTSSAATAANQTFNPFPEVVSGEQNPSPDMGGYATALKEYGDQHNFVPVYSVRQLSSAPPRFKATVVFNGRHFEGTARNKKHARHQAASKACSYLGIETSD